MQRVEKPYRRSVPGEMTVTIVWGLLAWFLVSIPVALFAAAFIEAGKGKRAGQ